MNQIVKIFSINLLIGFICYIIIAAFFYSFNIRETQHRSVITEFDSNTIRATYPNYKNFKKETAFAIFKEYSEPSTNYVPFTGYRRKRYSGTVVNIDKNGFRKSINHHINNSIWFFGGSTMWGTGATDNSTIPSYVAFLTGENVLNLGESSYNSFQELIELQIMLVKGFKPKAVVFYDGVNDGYYFCQRGVTLPTHSYVSRYKKMIQNYKETRKKMEYLDNIQKMALQAASFIDFFQIKLSKLYNFLNAPYIYISQRQNTNSDIKHNLTIEKKYSELNVTKKYLYCDEAKYLTNATKITVNSWINAYKLLKEYHIPILFVLQPAATFHPNNYNIDYIIDTQKQAIKNEEKSYYAYYNGLLEEWNKQCKKYGICNNFLNLSEIFFYDPNPVFIDTCHISPNGNKIVAENIVKSLSQVSSLD